MVAQGCPGCDTGCNFCSVPHNFYLSQEGYATPHLHVSMAEHPVSVMSRRPYGCRQASLSLGSRLITRSFHPLKRPRRGPCQCANQVTVQGATYQDVVLRLANMAIGKAVAEKRKNYIVGIAGVPGSGKSTLAQLVCTTINSLCRKALPGQLTDRAVMVPMDGFHYYKRELDEMPDPKEAYARRGAHWTFNAVRFVQCVHTIHNDGAVSMPSFDHAKGDPVENDISVTLEHKIVLVEGNYLLLPDEPWVQLREVFADTWFVDCPIDTTMQRVFERQTAIGLAPDVSRTRIATNDRPNAELIQTTRQYARVLVPSTIPLDSTMTT